ncbi:hypothetical protein [Enterobacter asburiae]|uniref:hypothetical protein n=1 Tax=Enterobacter asburiae TaxID=61645 RepID=UPI002003811D|nr:hypothetical protein [Enterobacter asburiae]MCK6676080.1 hypothetical protein [Enterobacter asburiae]
MEKLNVRSDKALMVSINIEDAYQLEKIKHGLIFHFKESGEIPDSNNQFSGSTGSVFDCEAN